MFPEVTQQLGERAGAPGAVFWWESGGLLELWVAGLESGVWPQPPS